MTDIWKGSRFVKSLTVCVSIVGALLGGLGSGALAVSDDLTDNEEAASRLEEPVESSVEADQSELVIAAVRTQLSDLDRFPLFLPSSRGTLVSASSQLSPRRQSRPSLFWIQDQMGARYGSDRLVDQWQAYQVKDATGTSLNYVDAIVNERIWDLLTYFERYAFMEQFGTAAQDYGYHLRVFHTGDAANADEAQATGNAELVTLRGAHVCSFGQSVLLPSTISSETLPCAVVFDSLSRARRRSILSD